MNEPAMRILRGMVKVKRNKKVKVKKMSKRKAALMLKGDRRKK
jgi:hypothetical protein